MDYDQHHAPRVNDSFQSYSHLPEVPGIWKKNQVETLMENLGGTWIASLDCVNLEVVIFFFNFKTKNLSTWNTDHWGMSGNVWNLMQQRLLT